MLVMLTEYVHTGQTKILLDHGVNENFESITVSPSSLVSNIGIQDNRGLPASDWGWLFEACLA